MFLTKNTDDANDLFTETYLKAVDGRDSFKEETSIKAWLKTIMYNSFIDHIRRNTKFRMESEDLLIPFENTLTMLPDACLMTKEMDYLIDNCKHHYSKVFRMTIDGYKYREIAEKLDIPLGTVKGSVFLARKELIQQLNS